MAKHRICFTGMDRAEEEALASLFNRLNAKLGNPFTLATEAEADILVVDGNPLEDISLIEDPEANMKLIIKDGRVHKNALEA
mgnify:CR=1 FL=1